MAEVLHYRTSTFFSFTNPLTPFVQTGAEHHYLYGPTEYFGRKNFVVSAQPTLEIDVPPGINFNGDRRLAVVGGRVLPGPQEVPSITYIRARITSNFYIRFFVRNVGFDPVFAYEVWFSEIRP